MKLPVRSLLSRVFLVHAAVLCLAAIAVPLTIDVMLQERTAALERRVLEDRAALIAEALSLAPDGRPRLSPERYKRQGESGEFGYAVVDASGAVLIASSAMAGTILSVLPREENARFSTIESGQTRYDTISRPVTVDGAGFWILLGWDVGGEDVIFDDVVQGFLWNAFMLTVPLLALLLVLDAFIVRRFFRPVLRASRQVQELDAAAVDKRLPVADLPAEILPLANAFNAALEKVERSYRLQKEFTADAAHELGTPMAVLDARLQTLPSSETRTALLADVKLMSRIVSQLLDMATLERADETAEETDLLAVSRHVLAELAPEAIAKGQKLGLSEPEGMASLNVVAREQDVWHMLRNLVENAIRHTPSGTTIDVILAADGSITVQDDGPGIPEEMHEHIFKRFWRRKRSDGSGAGLGMAIVQRVAQSNGGSITLRSREGEGTAFIVRLLRANGRASTS